MIARFLSLFFLPLSFPFPRYDAKSPVSSPPQSSITDRDRYRSNIALPAIGIDRLLVLIDDNRGRHVSFAILKLHYEPLADLGGPGRYSGMENLSPFLRRSTGLSRVIRHQTADRCYLLYNVVRGAGKRDVVQSEGAYML